MATDNKIQVFQGNTLSVTCTIISGLTDLDGYTATLTVKDRAGTEKLSTDGSINGLDITFVVTATENDIDPDNYTYDVTLYGDSSGNDDVFTVTQDTYLVKKR